MKKLYKNLILIIWIAIFLFLAVLQISFLNNFDLTFNIFLILIIFLIFSQNIYSALFLAWSGGFLLDTVSFSFFGINSLILLTLTAFLIIFQKKVLIVNKTENILIMGIMAIFLYRFLGWTINSILISKQEKFSFYLFNFGVFTELILTISLLFIIFYFIDRLTFKIK